MYAGIAGIGVSSKIPVKRCGVACADWHAVCPPSLEEVSRMLKREDASSAAMPAWLPTTVSSEPLE